MQMCKYLWTCKLRICSLDGCQSSWLYSFLAYRLTAKPLRWSIPSLLSEEMLSHQPQLTDNPTGAHRSKRAPELLPCLSQQIPWATACCVLVFLSTKQAAGTAGRWPPCALQHELLTTINTNQRYSIFQWPHKIHCCQASDFPLKKSYIPAKQIPSSPSQCFPQCLQPDQLQGRARSIYSPLHLQTKAWVLFISSKPLLPIYSKFVSLTIKIKGADVSWLK